MVEVLAQGLFTLAVTLLMLFVLEVELHMDVGFVVNTLMMGGMVCKMFQQFCKTASAVVKWLTAVCTAASRSSSRDIAEAESVQEMVLHDAGFNAFHLGKGLEDSSLHKFACDESNKPGSQEPDVGLGVFCHDFPRPRDESLLESPVDVLDVEISEVFSERTASVCDHQL